MPKIELGAIAPAAVTVSEPLAFSVPEQGEFTFYLREPDFPLMLAIEGEAERLTEKYAKDGRYPVDFYLPTSPYLCRTVAMVGTLLCDANGRRLKGDEAYAEGDLFILSAKLPEVMSALSAEAARLYTAAQAKLGNALGGLPALLSAAPSTTDSSPTPTSSDTSSAPSGASPPATES